MAQVSIVKHSEIENLRMDSEYYRPNVLSNIKIIRTLKNFENKKISIIKSGSTPRNRDENLKEGIILLKTNNIRNNVLLYDVPENFFFINDTLDTKLKSTKLKEKDVLINIVGATTKVIGRVAFVNKDFPKANITQAMAFCRLKDDSVLPEFLFIYLQTKYSTLQIERLARPTGQYNLNLDEVGRILVPILSKSFQEKVQRTVIELSNKQALQLLKYKEAEQLLLKKINLKRYPPKHKLSFCSTLSKILESKRIDAEYYHPKYTEIEDVLNKYELMNLGNKNFFSITTGVYCPEYSKHSGNMYIRSVDISDVYIDAKKIYMTEIELGNKFRAKKEDILISRVGSIGTVGYVDTELEGAYISDNILRVRNSSPRLNNLFLAFYLSKIGSKFMYRLSRGSVQQRLNQETLKEINIPILNIQTQNKIVNKLKESYKLRKESKELLKKAKKMVEDEIERVFSENVRQS